MTPQVRYDGIIVTRMPGGEDRVSARAVRLVVRGFLSYRGREAVALRVSLQLKGRLSRSEIRLEAVGLAIGGEPYIRLVADVWLPCGEYEVTTPVLPEKVVGFQVRPDHPFPVSKCRHDAKHPSTFRTRYVFSSSGMLAAAEQVITLHPCCAVLVPSGTNAYWLNVTQPMGSSVVMTGQEGKTWTVPPGKYFVTNPEADHWIAPHQKFPITFRRVILSQSIIRSLRTEMGLPKSLGPLGFVEGPRRMTPGVRRALALFDTVSPEAQETYVTLAARVLLMNLLQDHPSALRVKRGTERPPCIEDPTVTTMIQLMRSRLAETVEINQLAKEVGVSSAQLRQRFRKVMHQSPKDYFKALRLDQAVRWLKEGCQSVADISRLVGYRDVRSFYRVFRQYTGTHPTAVRPSSSPRRIRQ